MISETCLYFVRISFYDTPNMPQSFVHNNFYNFLLDALVYAEKFQRFLRQIRDFSHSFYVSLLSSSRYPFPYMLFIFL